MSDIIPFLPNRPDDEGSDLAISHDTFLIEEGLALLSAYRNIQDPEVRAAVVQFIKVLAGNTSKADGLSR